MVTLHPSKVALTVRVRYPAPNHIEVSMCSSVCKSSFSIEEFEKLAKTLSDYILEHGNPHCIAVITGEKAEIFSGMIGVIFPENTEKE